MKYIATDLIVKQKNTMELPAQTQCLILKFLQSYHKWVNKWDDQLLGEDQWGR